MATITTVTVGDVTDNLAQGQTPTVASTDGVIIQTEKLFTARSRAAAVGGTGQYDRGPTAYIKVMTSQPQYSEYLSGSTRRDLNFPQLIGENGDLTNAADTGESPKLNGYDKFLLTGIRGNMTEKVQITEVFGDGEVVYYFGRSPMIFNLSGLLIDSPDNSWFTDWLAMYSDVMRGAQTAKNYELLKIVLPNMILTGTMMNFSWEQNAARDVDIPFSFDFLAKLVEPVPVVTTGLPTSNLIAGVDFSKAAAFTGQNEINKTKASLSSIIQDPTSTLQDKAFAITSFGSGVSSVFQANRQVLTATSQSIDNATKSENSFFQGVAQSTMFQTTTAALNGIRTNLFSPIYGVLNSLTKLVSNTLGNSVRLFLSVSVPVRNILRDITNVSKQAINLVNLVNTAAPNFGRFVSGEIRGVSADYKTAIKSLSKAAGVIATAPATATQSLTFLFQSGAIPANSPFLLSSPKTSYARPSLSSGSTKAVSKAVLLRSVALYSPKTSNRL